MSSTWSNQATGPLTGYNGNQWAARLKYVINEYETYVTATCRVFIYCKNTGLNTNTFEVTLSGTNQSNHTVSNPTVKLSAGEEGEFITARTYRWNRTHSNQTVTITGKVYSYGGTVGGTSSATYKFTVRAKTSFTITYNGNGGTSLANQTGWYGETLSLRSDIPTQTNHSFINWNEADDGSGTSHSPGSSFTPYRNLNLYAQWKLDYTAPVISNLIAVRVDDNGDESDEGKKIKITFDYTPGKTGTTNYTPTAGNTGPSKIVITGPGTNITYTALDFTKSQEYIFPNTSASNPNEYSIDDSYTISVTIGDSDHPNQAITKSIVVSSAIFLIDITGDGKAMALMGTAKTGQPLTLPTKTYVDSVLLDYVIEQGVTNDWRWRKWSSGRYEAERVRNIGQVSLYNADYSTSTGVYASNAIEVGVPPHTLVNGSVEVAYLGTSSNSASWLQRTSLTHFRIAKAATVNTTVLQNVTISERVVGGTWK